MANIKNSSCPSLGFSVSAITDGLWLVLVVCLQVQSRLAGIEERYKEVVELTRLRKQALQDALALYKMLSEANACEVWIDEKEQWLNSMEIPEKLEDLEVVQHR